MSNPQDPTSPVHFKYVKDFTISSEDFLVGVLEPDQPVGSFQVSDCYPNPCKDFTTLSIIAKSDLEVSITLMNYLGKTMRLYPIMTCRTGKNDFSIDFSGGPCGTYFIEVESGKGKVVRKIVVE